ncbi:MAG: hypothetical protein HFF50_07910 [Lawsonibacter sp.]|nr:hypothetical protein [Lawsonibacter sp.]
MKEKKSSDWKAIAGGILLIAVLFAGIKLIFAGLERAIPHPPADGSSVSVQAPAASGEEAPSFCLYCGRGLPEGFQWGQFCPWCGEKLEG